MKGFVPVTKKALINMVMECEKELALQVSEETDTLVTSFIDYEVKRSTTRRFFGLLKPHQPRFDLTFTGALVFSDERIHFDDWETGSYRQLNQDKDNSIKWLDRLRHIAYNEYCGEPILLDTDTFSRLSNPSKYRWARYNGYSFSIRD